MEVRAMQISISNTEASLDVEVFAINNFFSLV